MLVKAVVRAYLLVLRRRVVWRGVLIDADEKKPHGLQQRGHLCVCVCVCVCVRVSDRMSERESECVSVWVCECVSV